VDKRILLAEDEENLRETLSLNLELEGYEVVTASTGTDALNHFFKAVFHLVILDVMLPELDGFAICKRIKSEKPDMPVLFLTAKGAAEDRVTGLKIGADDYIVKPFHLEELLLRVEKLIKRSQRQASPISSGEYSFGDNKVNFSTYEVKTFRGEQESLSKKEIQLLKLLIDRKGEVVSRDEILETVWGYDVYPSTRTIDNFILSFRKLFEKDPKEPMHFHSVRGVGYKFSDQ
jgi:two-component system, OmpR family, alkaline phosphatase synthesis response regulator PhoP